MRYTIGETAKILGISSELLRHYERMGIITPQRHANGYRYYDLDTIKKLTGVRRWRAMGFLLEDAEQLLTSTSRDNTLHLYHKRLAQMEQELCWQQEVQAAMRESVREIETAEAAVGSFSVRDMPDMLRIVSQHNHEFEVCDRRRYRNWLDSMPVVCISPGFTLDDIQAGNDTHQFGYVVALEKAHKLGLDQTEGAQLIKAGPCASTVIFSEGAGHIKASQLKFLLSLLQEKAFTPAGDAWGITIGCFTEGADRRKYHRMFLPITV